MYFIYHIPGVKIGCTKNYPKRCIRQGYTDYELLEMHEDGWIAGDREQELQQEYGYEVDKVHYMLSTQNRDRAMQTMKERGNHNFTTMTEDGRKYISSLGGKKVAETRRNLTFEQAEEIRTKYATGNYSQRGLAKEYNISRAALQRIITNQTYLD